MSADCKHNSIQSWGSPDGRKRFETCLACGKVQTIRRTSLGEFTDNVWRTPKKGWPSNGRLAASIYDKAEAQ